MAKKKKNYIPTIPKEWTRKPIYWIIIIIALGVIYYLNHRKENSNEPKIENSAINVTSIKNIAEWEFLTIETEELVDTIVKHKICDDHFAKIYNGTLHLGINLSKCKKNWILNDNGTIKITLPQIELLDKNFIDETKTKTFYESGTISASVKSKMLSKAKKNMKNRALSQDNISIAKENAKNQFIYMFNSMGYKNVVVSFQ